MSNDLLIGKHLRSLAWVNCFGENESSRTSTSCINIDNLHLHNLYIVKDVFISIDTTIWCKTPKIPLEFQLLIRYPPPAEVNSVIEMDMLGCCWKLRRILVNNQKDRGCFRVFISLKWHPPRANDRRTAEV